MEQAIIALDDALADYRRYADLADVTEQTAEALASAAAAVLDMWDFDRGIPRVIGIDNRPSSGDN